MTRQVGFGTVDATAALKMAGRLARDQGTGRGLVAAAQFGGGTAAIPPVPVAPRAKRQFLVDSLIALACLAVVLIVGVPPDRDPQARRRAGRLAGPPVRPAAGHRPRCAWPGWAGPPSRASGPARLAAWAEPAPPTARAPGSLGEAGPG